MISQAVIIKDNQVLMVKQYVQRGDIVWNFPGGNVEKYETPIQACIREVKEETGYDVITKNILYQNENKYTFLAEIIGGALSLNNDLEDNVDIIETAWVSLVDDEKFDCYTKPILDLYIRGKFR